MVFINTFCYNDQIIKTQLGSKKFCFEVASSCTSDQTTAMWVECPWDSEGNSPDGTVLPHTGFMLESLMCISPLNHSPLHVKTLWTYKPQKSEVKVFSLSSNQQLLGLDSQWIHQFPLGKAWNESWLLFTILYCTFEVHKDLRYLLFADLCVWSFE